RARHRLETTRHACSTSPERGRTPSGFHRRAEPFAGIRRHHQPREQEPRGMNALNVPMRFILGLPFATPLSGQLMLLYLTGRKTGKSYQQPVSYVPDGNTLLTPGGGRWKLNLRPGECTRIRLRGRDVLARAELVN